MTAPLLLDFFCCQGGASRGYERAGFKVRGFDLSPQPHYPYPFEQGDALEIFADAVKRYRPAAIAGSPPCQGYSDCQRIQDREHPKLIVPFRELCEASGLPYIIENVEGARSEMKDPVMLCGERMGLRTHRHRLFESNVTLAVPEHLPHTARKVKMGRRVATGDWYHAVGNFSDPDKWIKKDMDVEWMTRDGVRECIPPIYTDYLGRQLLAAL